MNINKHWEFIGLGLAFIIDVLFNLGGFTTAFSIGWLLMMIITYKDLRKKYSFGGLDE